MCTPRLVILRICVSAYTSNICLIVIHSPRVDDGRMRVPTQGRAGYVTSQPETASLNPAYMFSFIQSTFLQPPQNYLKYLDIQLTNKTYV